MGDPDTDSLDIADFGRWAKLGTYIKEHGENGEITLTEPARAAVSMLQLSSLQDVFECFKKMKNVTVSLVTDTSVSIHIKYEKWLKYQGDYSTDRVRKNRAKKHENETPKKRREEKRGEESKKEEERKSMSDEEWINSLRENPIYEGLDIDKLHGKMLVWCKTNGKKATRKRFVNWLNREELPMKPVKGESKFADKYAGIGTTVQN